MLAVGEEVSLEGWVNVDVAGGRPEMSVTAGRGCGAGGSENSEWLLSRWVRLEPEMEWRVRSVQLCWYLRLWRISRGRASVGDFAPVVVRREERAEGWGGVEVVDGKAMLVWKELSSLC